MEHAASPSLISLGLTSDISSGGSPFRSGLALSILLHAFVLVLAMFIRFESDIEQPFRTIDVSLISLPTSPATAPKAAPSTTKKTAAAPVPPKVVSPPTPAPPKVEPPTSAPTPAPTAPPVEEILPPLPTNTASERLSESLGGAINSIVVPQKRATAETPTPSSEPTVRPSEDQTPLLDNLQLPESPPTIARAKRLQPAEPLNIPSIPEPPQASAPQKAQTPTKSHPTPSPPPAVKPRPAFKPAPAIPSLSEVTPFSKPKKTTIQPKAPKTPKIEETLKQSLSEIQTPTSTPKVPKISRKRPARRPKPKTSPPKISAPQLSDIPKTPTPQISKPAQPKMSDTVKKLMEGLKSTTRVPQAKQVPVEPRPTPPRTAAPSITPSPAAIDQRIAKLSIPEVAPVESIKQRLSLLEVEAAGNPGSSTAKPSSGKNRYLAMVEDRIDRQWVAPPLLTSNPVVVLKFHISRSGEISSIQILESSGHAHYDSSAQRAVQLVNPLPAFPADISDSFFDVKYRFIKD